jgi:hypothetical protein
MVFPQFAEFMAPSHIEWVRKTEYPISNTEYPTDELSPILFKSIDATQKGECDNFLGYWTFHVG